jgi:hypothetical protein
VGFEPLRLGTQRPYWQAGGPSGFENGTAGHVNPWPYITGFINFLTPGPYGTANTAAAAKAWPYMTAVQSFNPIGYYKAPTYTQLNF